MIDVIVLFGKVREGLLVTIYAEKVMADMKHAAGCLLFSHASSIFLELAMLVSLLVSQSTTSVQTQIFQLLDGSP